MGRKIFVFTDMDGKILGSFTPVASQVHDPKAPTIATDIVIPGQMLHELEIPSHLPDDVATDVLHEELSKIIAQKA
jgi:hypothetical protein